MKKTTTISNSTKEVIFQLVLHFLVFIFYSFDKETPHIGSHHYTFFLSYAIAAFVINYWLLPKYFYRKKYLIFILAFLAIIAALILVEEVILEPIYFPGRRADTFPGLFFTSVKIFPMIIILVGFKFGWDALGKQREVDRLTNAMQESELQFLKSQINPHFLFNNLNNLYSYAIENSPKTPTIILELSSVLRYMLYECKEKYVPLSKELEQLENFTRLSQLQIEERGEVNINIPDIPHGYKIAPLILIVFIENAFKHSQSSQSENIYIDIDIKVSEAGRLEFICKNNFQPTTNTQNLAQGIGLENVKKRLELIYPNNHQLTISEGENLYEVYLSLQLTKSIQP